MVIENKVELNSSISGSLKSYVSQIFSKKSGGSAAGSINSMGLKFGQELKP